MKTRIAIIGRFQPFHWGHYDYLMAASLIASHVRVGVAYPYSNSNYIHQSDLRRSLPDANPFTYAERCQMIERTVGLLSPHVDVEFVPCLLGEPKVIQDSLGGDVSVAITIYDDWGRHKESLLRNAGYEVHILWTDRLKMVRGEEIRNRLRQGAAWEHLVPPGTASVIWEGMKKRSR